MGHRAKHNFAALVRRVKTDRKIKSDLTAEGASQYVKTAVAIAHREDPQSGSTPDYMTPEYAAQLDAVLQAWQRNQDKDKEQETADA